jgi:type II secretory pathway component PulC
VKAVRNRPLPQQNAVKRPVVPAAILQPEQHEIPIVSARPVVRVNGIAFQDGSDSVAVINGVPVSRGALIEGIKVEEIQRDRVQFSYDGEKFEVNLGKSNQ